MKIILTENQLKSIVEASIKEINIEANNTDLHPTDPQKEAGNYKKGHISIKGMGISIENPKGSIRKGKDENGNEFETLIKNHYGYFRNTSGNGKDGDAVDVFVGPSPDDFDTVYVIDQNNKDGEFDESKVMLGFKSKESAKNAYMSNYKKGWTGFKTITGVSIGLFKKWLYRKHKQRKPFSEYVEIQKKKLEENKKNLDEIVYVNNADSSTKKANVTYEKGKNRPKGDSLNFVPNDSLKTDKMDQNDSGTYEVTLKNGFKSYNITSINGENIMHCLKYRYDKKNKAKAKIGGSEFELSMDDKSYKDFMSQFLNKMKIIIEDFLSKRKNGNEGIEKICLYPVKSTSNFNIEIANEIASTIGNGKITVLNDNILTKDTNGIELDNDFIGLNKAHYNGTYYAHPGVGGTDDSTVMQQVQTYYNKCMAVKNDESGENVVGNYIDKANAMSMSILQRVKNFLEKNIKLDVNALANNIKSYRMVVNNKPELYYVSAIDNKVHRIRVDKIIVPDKNLEDEFEAVSNFIAKNYPNLTGGKLISFHKFVRKPYEIKSIANNIRMAFTGYYRPTKEPNLINREKKKIANSLLIIFDDNISGGATLSDVCGVFNKKPFMVPKENIIPITLGKMSEKWALQSIPLSKPKNYFGDYLFNFDSNIPTEQEIQNHLNKAKKRGGRKPIVRTQSIISDNEAIRINFEQKSFGEREIGKNFEHSNYFYVPINIEKIPYEENNPNILNVLWVDDSRKGNEFFTSSWKKKIFEESYINTSGFYKRIFDNGNYVHFTNVNCFVKFMQYISNCFSMRKMPNLVSFDCDLGNGDNGFLCALYLYWVCKKHGLQMPYTFVHSANNSEKGLKGPALRAFLENPKEFLINNAVETRSNSVNKRLIYSAIERLRYETKRNITLDYLIK